MSSTNDPDITGILTDWPLEPGKINARVITGRDGRKHVQVRIEMGLLQMPLDGSPSGDSHEGFDSLLHYQKDRFRRYERETGSSLGFVLSADECRMLRHEAVQLYHRYVALFAIKDFQRVVRDARLSLDIFDLCQNYAAEDSDRWMLEQFRPQVITMLGRAQAEQAVADDQPRQALEHLSAAIEQLREIFEEAGGAEDQFEQSNEVQLLRGMREALVPRLPVSQKAELEERLRAALDAENYELAAILRDELRIARDEPESSQRENE